MDNREKRFDALLRDALGELNREEWDEIGNAAQDDLPDFSPDFEKSVREKLGGGKEPAKAAPTARTNAGGGWRKRVFALAAVCAALFALGLGVEAGRYLRWEGVIGNRSGGHYRIVYETEEETLGSILKKHEPREPVSAYRRQVAGDSDTSYDLLYTEDGALVMTFSQSVIDPDYGIYYNSSYRFKDAESVNVGQYPGELLRHTDGVSLALTWCDGEYSYDLRSYSTEITEEDLLAVAESVR